MSTSSTNPAEQQAFAAIQTQYQEALAFLQAMQADTAKIELDEQWIAAYKSLGLNPSGYEADEASVKADLEAQEESLAKTDPSFATLSDTLNSLLDCIETTAGDGNAGVDNVEKDLETIQSSLDKLFAAMKQKLEGDLYTAELNSPEAGSLSADQLAALAEDGIQYQSSEMGLLSDMMDSLSSAITDYHTAYNSANTDLNRYNFWDDVASFFGLSNAKKNQKRDKEIMENATDMMKGLSKVMSALAPEMASLVPQFSEIVIVIQTIIKRIEEILANASMTPKEKETAVLGLVMFLLTFFQVLKQQMETEKGGNNQEMSKGAIDSSQINIDNTIANQTILQEQEKNAKIMKLTMLVSEVVLGAAMMVIAPGIGTALLVGLVTVFQTLQTEGIFDPTSELAKAIGGKWGKILADATVAAAEIALTVGGGALLDMAVAKLIAKGMETAVQTAVESSEALIQKGVQTALATAGKLNDPAAAAAVENLLRQLAEKTAQKAAQGVADQFLRQSFATLVESAAKGVLQKTLQETMEKAAQDAIETMIEDSARVAARLAAKGVQASEATLDGIASSSANGSVAAFSGKSAEAIGKEADRSALQIAGSRAGWSALFGYANTGMFVDMLKKTGISNDTLLEIFQVIEQLIQIVALVEGSGMNSSPAIKGIVSNLPRTVSLMGLAPQTVQVLGSYGMYEADMSQSKAVRGISMNESIADLLHAFIEQLQKDSNLDRDIMIREQTQEAQSTSSMASHLHDGDQAAIQILISAAG